MSYTILPFINPPAQYTDMAVAVTNINLIDNNYQVPQSFNGIHNSSTSRFMGECVFDAVPKFNAGIEVHLSEVNTGVLTVGQLTTLNGGLIVTGTMDLPNESVGQLEVEKGYINLIENQLVNGQKEFIIPPLLSGLGILSETIQSESIISKSITASQIADGTIVQSLVYNNYVDLITPQVIGGVKSFNLPPILSGSSIELNSINGSSIVSQSITSNYIQPSSIVQESLLNGYMDLITSQSVNGDKSFLGNTNFQAISAVGNSTLDQVQCGQIYATDINVNNNVSATTFTGALNGNSSTCDIATNIIVSTDNSDGLFPIAFVKSSTGNDKIYTDDTSTPFLTYNPSSGSLKTENLNIAGVTSLNFVSLPTSITSLSLIGGVLNIPLAGYSLGNYNFNMGARVTGVSFTGAIVGARAVLIIRVGGTNQVFNKNTSSGTWANLNNLAGNTTMNQNSTWIVNIYVISPTLVSMTYANIT